VPARALRVLWLTKGLGPGGAERLLVTHAAVNDPDRVAYEAAYLLPHKRHLVSELEALGVPTHDLASPRDVDPRWLRRLGRLVEQGSFDIVHAHSPASAAQARLLMQSIPRSRRPAFVYTEHNRWPSHSRATRAANSATFGLNDAVISVSDEVRESMAPRHRDVARTIVHGIDTEAVAARRADRDAVRAELGVDPDQVMVVTVANFRAPKGYPDLLAAAERVRASRPDVRFVIVGQGPLEQELRAEHARLGLAETVTILGYRADAPRITAAADLFALASHHEGIPVAVMEALAAGVPVVATRVGGLAEAVDEGTSGRLVTARRPDLLAGAIVELASDEAARRALSAGATEASARFSARRSAREIEEVYDRALAATLQPRLGRRLPRRRS
jgi:glycosyltransferase involved in cell wall biosynthesis